jgi:hypothetical protein
MYPTAGPLLVDIFGCWVAGLIYPGFGPSFVDIIGWVGVTEAVNPDPIFFSEERIESYQAIVIYL